MRGSPLLRALCALVVIASLGYPLWRLTSASATAVPPSVAAETAVQTVNLRLAFTTRPTELEVLHLGTVIWSEAAPAAEFERQLQLPFPEEGIDLEFRFTWPESGLAAARVELTDPNGEAHERTLWGKGAMNEVLTFP